MHHAPARIVLVTGGSRGIGADVAQQLAGPDTHVIVNYRECADHAEATCQGHPDAGGNASTLRADISNEDECAAMIDTIAARLRTVGHRGPQRVSRAPSWAPTRATRAAATAMLNVASR